MCVASGPAMDEDPSPNDQLTLYGDVPPMTDELTLTSSGGPHPPEVIEVAMEGREWTVRFTVADAATPAPSTTVALAQAGPAIWNAWSGAATVAVPPSEKRQLTTTGASPPETFAWKVAEAPTSV